MALVAGLDAFDNGTVVPEGSATVLTMTTSVAAASRTVTVSQTQTAPPDVVVVPARKRGRPRKSAPAPVAEVPLSAVVKKPEEPKKTERKIKVEVEVKAKPKTIAKVETAKPRREKPKKPTEKPKLLPAAEDLRCPPGDPACSLGVMGGVCSVPAPLYVANPSGPPTPQVARYCVVDANALVPSHAPLNGWRPNPRYPSEVQERRYDKDQGEQLKVAQIAQQLVPEVVFNRNPDAINGPPIITEKGVVLGGNGRSMALQLHYLGADDKPAAKYLIKHAKEFGFTADEVRGIHRPVLVRVVKTPDDKPATLAKLVRRYNESMTQGMDPRATSVAQARQLPQSALDVFTATIGPDETLSAYLSSRASRPFIDELRTAGIVNQRNATQLLTSDGMLNDEGRSLVERVLTATVVRDATLLEDMGAQLRSAIARIVPDVIIASGGESQWDLRAALAAAARDVVRMKSQSIVRVDEYLASRGLFSDIKPAVEGVPLGPEVLELLWNLASTPVKLAKVVARYAALARRNPRGQEGFEFGDVAKPITPAEALRP